MYGGAEAHDMPNRDGGLPTMAKCAAPQLLPNVTTNIQNEREVAVLIR